MKQITCDFPSLDTKEAVEEVKASDRENTFLQSCQVPEIAGGKVDVLLGVRYSIIHPVPVQELECGLTIYKSRLISHDSSYNALIGGPHSSFKILSGMAGSVGRLLAHFSEGLMNIRKLGAPRIPVNPLSIEEERFALLHNSVEYRDLRLDSVSDAKDQHLCTPCFISKLEDSAETLNEIRKLRLQQEFGIENDYRCVKCRDCGNCKNADRTEYISLKEEMEMDLIDKSVELDLEKKQITCTLPLKGDERQYLSCNYSQAKKILDQQVRQYGKDNTTREMIIKAFEKLFSNGHAAFLEDLSAEELESFKRKEIQYFIPWRVAFSDSVTTPARPVLDASSKTWTRQDGSGGKSLNDLVCQGKVDTLNLMNLVLNFRVGKFALTGDLEQFYNTCKLKSSQWNLQRFLFQENLDPTMPIREGCIKTLIYGVASVSAQSENAMRKLGNVVEAEMPEVKNLIEKRRYVDDIGDSKADLEACIKLSEDANKAFAMVNLNCKAWTISGQDPDPKVSKDGSSIGVAGSTWYSKLDVFIVKVPPLHFGRRRRGRLDPCTKFFTGETIEEMDSFTPNPLSRKQVASKYASIWDITGKLGPVLADAKDLLRQTVMSTVDWNSAMPSELRSKWVSQFILWEKLRGLRFDRAVMPQDAIDSKMRLICLVDASDKIVVQGCWGGFRRRSGEWSCQHILSRTLLADKNSTIPKMELQSLTNGGNMCWLIRKLLTDWVHDYIVCGDSVISLCWVSSEKKSLSIFHRNRVLQIRRSLELDRLYHVRTNENLADLGTRPDKVKLSDVGPDSEWELGKGWMRSDVNDAIQNGILKPISELRLSVEKDAEDFKSGFLYGDEDHDMMCNAVNVNRVQKLQSRIQVSNYLVLPSRFGLAKTVRITAIVLAFIDKCRRKSIQSGE